MARQIGDVVLEVEDLHTYCFTRFGTVKAVDGVSFNLRQGEALAIVGESGLRCCSCSRGRRRAS